MREEIVKWKRKVILLDILEHRLFKAYKDKKINHDKYLIFKEKIDNAWVRIYDTHPDTHPLSIEIFNKFVLDVRGGEEK